MNDRATDSGTEASLSRCPAVVRWLPRVLGGALLAAAMIVITSLGPSLSGGWRVVLSVAAGVVSLWAVRAGSEVRLEAGLVGDALRMGARGRFLDIPLREIEILDYDPPFAMARKWFPALVVIDRHDRRYRVPAALSGGRRLLEEIVERSNDDRLRAFAEARRLSGRIGLSPVFTALGYVLASGFVMGALWFTRT